MIQHSVRWDAENTHHILVQNAERSITKSEVEEVLLNSGTVKWFARGGRFFATGRTMTGRCLRVVFTGIHEPRPVSAWQLRRKECARWSM